MKTIQAVIQQGFRTLSEGTFTKYDLGGYSSAERQWSQKTEDTCAGIMNSNFEVVSQEHKLILTLY